MKIKINKKNFKGLDYYRLYEDKNGNINIRNYNDVLNARRARVDLLLDNAKEVNNVILLKINKALSKLFTKNKELLFEFNTEDKKIADEKIKIFKIIDNINNLKIFNSKDLIETSLLLSDLSFIERNIILCKNKNSRFLEFKFFFF